MRKWYSKEGHNYRNKTKNDPSKTNKNQLWVLKQLHEQLQNQDADLPNT